MQPEMRVKTYAENTFTYVGSLSFDSLVGVQQAENTFTYVGSLSFDPLGGVHQAEHCR